MPAVAYTTQYSNLAANPLPGIHLPVICPLCVHCWRLMVPCIYTLDLPLLEFPQYPPFDLDQLEF